jgi:hypothetical protein
MKILNFVAMVGVAAVSMSAVAADLTLNPTFGEQDTFDYAVCDSNPGTPVVACAGALSGPTSFTVDFTSLGTFNSSGSTSDSPQGAPGGFTAFSYNIYDPLMALVGTGSPQNPADIIISAPGEYTFQVAWALDTNGVQSANWQIVITSAQQVIPEPGSLALLGAALLGVAVTRRRYNKVQ